MGNSRRYTDEELEQLRAPIRRVLELRHWEGSTGGRSYRCKCESCIDIGLVTALAMERFDRIRADEMRARRLESPLGTRMTALAANLRRMADSGDFGKALEGEARAAEELVRRLEYAML